MILIEAQNKILNRFWIDFFAKQIKIRGLLFEQEIWENPKENLRKYLWTLSRHTIRYINSLLREKTLIPVNNPLIPINKLLYENNKVFSYWWYFYDITNTNITNLTNKQTQDLENCICFYVDDELLLIGSILRIHSQKCFKTISTYVKLSAMRACS